MDTTTYTENGIFMAENKFMIHHMVPLVIESKFVTVAFFLPMAEKHLKEVCMIRKKTHSRRLSISHSPTVTSFLLTPCLEKEGGHALIITVHILHWWTSSKIWMLEGILIPNVHTRISGIEKNGRNCLWIENYFGWSSISEYIFCVLVKINWDKQD